MKQFKVLILAVVIICLATPLRAELTSNTKGKTWYVSIKKGNNKNDGSKSSPLKNIQKAINSGKSGDIIKVAEGNYLGLMKIGYIDLKKKAVSIIGGYNNEFSQRDPIKYQTKIQPRPEQNGTSGNRPLLQIDFTGGSVLLDGIIFDRGRQTAYSIHKDKAQRGQPKGVESGRYMPPPRRGGNHGVGNVVSVLRPIIAGKVQKGSLTIQNYYPLEKAIKLVGAIKGKRMLLEMKNWQ